MAEQERQHEQGALDFYTDSADLFWQAWKGTRSVFTDGNRLFFLGRGKGLRECTTLLTGARSMLDAPDGSIKESLKQRLSDVMTRAEDLKGVSASINATPVMSRRTLII